MACLPSQTEATPTSGIQAGWSQPPPLPFIQKRAPAFEPFYSDFFKQWHYKLDIMKSCQDPNFLSFYRFNLVKIFNQTMPSNSSYPAGTMCAKDFTRRTCFTTGESGSPLMVQYGDHDARFHVEGILSSVKGCDGVTLPFLRNRGTTALLFQHSENPTIYTKLSCLLPWISSQYDLKYPISGARDMACQQGTGDPNDRNNPCWTTTLIRSFPPPAGVQGEPERKCIFPFYYQGIKYDKCILFTELDFVYPVFRCPVR